MVRLYLDLETYRPRKEGSFVEERIISSGLLINETPYREESVKESIDPMLISEWNGFSEQEIVSKVQDQVREALINHRFTVICGYNILRFDVPLLICRCVQTSNCVSGITIGSSDMNMLLFIIKRFLKAHYHRVPKFVSCC